VVFITVQNLVGVDAVVSIICKFKYFLENAYMEVWGLTP